MQQRARPDDNQQPPAKNTSSVSNTDGACIDGCSRNGQSEIGTESMALTIYVAQHCGTCDYAHEVGEEIRTRFPYVDVRFVDIEQPEEEIPEAVFATPTYLLNGRVWSLGNPSWQKVHETFAEMVQ